MTSHRKRFLIVQSAMAAVFSICFAMALATGRAWPHQAPTGWQYGWECCSFTDCRQMASDAVAETPQGYTIKLTGEVIPYGDKRLKQSKDEFYHQCTKGGDPNEKHSICLYTPDRGF